MADTFTQEVEILEGPTAGFETDYDPCFKGIVTFKDNATAGNQFWDYDDGNTANQFTKEYIFAKDGQYEVSQQVTLPNGCADTFKAQITLASNPGGALQLYNVFTPNGDNFNTCWEPDGINTDCEEVKYRIYNRYGVLVFNSEEHGACWNGKIFGTGAVATNGTYYYLLEVKRKDTGKEKEVYGVITLQK